MKNQRFTEVYNAYLDLIVKYVYRKTGSYEDSVELVQEVFLAFYQNMDSVKEEFQRPWLLLTAKNKCIDHYRKNARNEAAVMNWTGSLEIMQENNLEIVVERIVQETFAFQILEDLKRKNEKWYEVIEAVTVCGMSQEEAAAHLGISVDMLRSRLYRARKFIRRKYLEEYRDLLG